jgi:predicted PhzF superfamily epimerase YddE/YHI9
VTVTLLHVDAFADAPFRGNPAAVCLLDAPRPDRFMLALAAELNLPATAFVLDAGDAFAVRWFSPAMELALCGHGTLASAHALWETGRLAPTAAARFATQQSGELSATRGDGWIALDLPAEPATAVAPPAGLLEALGVQARWVGRNRLDYVVEVADEAAVRAAAPDLVALGAIETRGVIVTSRASTAGVDFVSRFFAPRVGIPEDAVTGSAHCCLAPLWSARLGAPRLTGGQVSARGGIVRAELAGDRVVLSGQAVTVLRGELC